MSKKQNHFKFNWIFLFKISAVVVLVLTLNLISKYYLHKSDRWFEPLPKQTIWALKTNTSLVSNPLASAKLRSLSAAVFTEEDSNLKLFFQSYNSPVTLLGILENNKIQPALLITQPLTQNPDQKPNNSPTKIANQINQSSNSDLELYFKQTPTGQTLVTTSPLDNLEYSSIKVPQSQLNNHPSNSFGYLYVNNQNLSDFLFAGELLTPLQKSIQATINQSDLNFFNIEAQDQKLFFSNYSNRAHIRQTNDYLSTNYIQDLEFQPEFLYSVENLKNALPNTTLGLITKITQNLGVSKKTIDDLLNSSLAVSKDNYGQFHFNFNFEIAPRQITDLIQAISNYFNPIQVTKTLATNQKNDFLLAQTTLSSPKTQSDQPQDSQTSAQNSQTSMYDNIDSENPIFLESINRYLHTTQLQTNQLELIFSPFETMPTQTSQPKVYNPDALIKAQEFLQFKLDQLNSYSKFDLPMFQTEIFSRDYRFGTHTLIVIE